MRQPVLFVSHGSPTLVRDATPAHLFLKTLGARLARPDAILAVSAHWETAAPTVGTAARPETIHDFHGFPRELYEVIYPAPGAPEVARAAHDLLAAAGFGPAPPDAARGLDHGAWVPLALMLPDADVPVFQVSVVPGRDAAWHRRLGAALAPLRERNVLILGSGAVTHSLRELDWGRIDVPAPDWVDAFADWVGDRVATGDPLDAWPGAPSARRNHPTPEHFLPLAVAQGAGGGAGERLHRSVEYGTLRMDAFRWGR